MQQKRCIIGRVMANRLPFLIAFVYAICCHVQALGMALTHGTKTLIFLSHPYLFVADFLLLA